MLRKDLVFECAFYGNKIDKLGCLYFRSLNLPVKNPDILFFCLYVSRILVEKKVASITADTIQKKLQMGTELEKLLQNNESDNNTFGIQMIEYKGFSKLEFSSSILLNKKMRYRFGYIGFGFFMNKKKFNRCAEYSVYGLINTIYKLNKKDKEQLGMLWQAAVQIGNLEFGKELYRGNYQFAAKKIYSLVTKEDSDYLNN